MSVGSRARRILGLLLRQFREQKGWRRTRLEQEVGLKKGVMARLEHGVVNPSRSEFIRVIKILELPAENREKADRLLKIIYPLRRRKFHLPIHVLCHRNRRR